MIRKPRRTADTASTRKFAGIMMLQHNVKALPIDSNQLTLPQMLKNSTNNNITPANTNTVNNPLFPGQQTTILTASGTMTITSTTAPTAPHIHPSVVELTENKISILPIPITSPPTTSSLSPTNVLISPNASSLILTATESVNETIETSPTVEQIITSNETEPIESIATTPTTTKERKRRIIIDDDDESPTFNPLNRSNKRFRGRGRRGKGGLLRQNQLRKMQLSPEKLGNILATSTSMPSLIAASTTPAAATTVSQDDDSNLFTSPEGIVSKKKNP